MTLSVPPTKLTQSKFIKQAGISASSQLTSSRRPIAWGLSEAGMRGYSAVSHVASDEAPFTAQHPSLNGHDCSLLITMGFFPEVNYTPFLNLGILKDLGYLSRFSGSSCVFLVITSPGCCLSYVKRWYLFCLSLLCLFVYSASPKVCNLLFLESRENTEPEVREPDVSLGSKTYPFCELEKGTLIRRI